MKNTLFLSKIEKAAFDGAMKDLMRAEEATRIAKAAAEEVIGEITAAHKAPPFLPGATVTGTAVDGRLAIIYESDDTPPVFRPAKPENGVSRLPVEAGEIKE